MDTLFPDAAEEAGRLQAIASDPSHSAFVSASAGSGKTKLLIDRLLRLMLPGDGREATAPDRILCLTFTKAAAAEMAIRLRRKLGAWVVLDDAALDRELAALSLPATVSVRGEARALFARVLDMPGGLRIGTIHAFCGELLRRFPLEARISPHFRLVEEADVRLALGRAREDAVGRSEMADAVAAIASVIAAARHAELTEDLGRAADRLRGVGDLAPEALAASLRTVLRVTDADEASLIARAAAEVDQTRLGVALAAIETGGSEANRRSAGPIRDWLAQDPAGRASSWADWVGLLCTDRGAPRQILRPGRFATAHPEINETFADEATRILSVEDARRSLALVRATAALLALAGPSLACYAAEKEALGLVDFDDLIRRTGLLLDEPGVAWVLFKLDGGLDHLLLDEVQDTSAVQWRIAGKLTEEFFAGEAAGRAGRTVFAVGDFKQSIYSFQGADPDAFHLWRRVFRDRAGGAGLGFVEPELAVSFRSTAPVLGFVDRVFSDPAAATGVAEAGRPVPRHRSSRPHAAGRVELWPLAKAAEEDAGEAGPWVPARVNRTGITAPQRLADALAARIARDIAAGTLKAGDVLVLVRRRGAFATAVVRALKARDVPVAGLDRLVLTEQPVVIDLLALCDAILLPDDDLALATVLTSPLGFTDDDGLMALALGRRGRTLWDTLRDRASEREDWRRSLALIERLRGRADWASPHALLTEALGVEGARARIFARLGPEAGEAIDEMLAAAIGYASSHVPSLQGFVHWLRRSGAEVKREAPEGADEVRLMTVHGSKGLEGRLVVLADTTSRPSVRDTLFWSEAPDEVLPVWVPGRDLRSSGSERLRARAEERMLAEYNRLLYVGLTRARDGLIVCGWATGKAGFDDGCWYAHCRRAMESDPGARPLDDLPGGERTGLEVQGSEVQGREGQGWEGPGLVLGGALDPTSAAAAVVRAAPSLPDWISHASISRPPPPASAGPRRTLAPSRPENAGYGVLPPALSPLAGRPGRDAGRADARRRGDALHALLQLLPVTAPGRRRADGVAMAAALLPGLDAASVASVVEEALGVIAHPALAAVFGPDGRAEQRVAGLVAGFTVDGVVDRMAIGPEAIEIVDFKSGRAAPVSPERTPVFHLRQMAAYRAVLQALRPGREVRCALVWTAEAAVVHLPADLLDRHAPGTWERDPAA